MHILSSIPPAKPFPGGPCSNATAFLSLWKGLCPEGLSPGWFAGLKACGFFLPSLAALGAVLSASPPRLPLAFPS